MEAQNYKLIICSSTCWKKETGHINFLHLFFFFYFYFSGKGIAPFDAMMQVPCAKFQVFFFNGEREGE